MGRTEGAVHVVASLVLRDRGTAAGALLWYVALLWHHDNLRTCLCVQTSANTYVDKCHRRAPKKNQRSHTSDASTPSDLENDSPWVRPESPEVIVCEPMTTEERRHFREYHTEQFPEGTAPGGTIFASAREFDLSKLLPLPCQSPQSHNS